MKLCCFSKTLMRYSGTQSVSHLYQVIFFFIISYGSLEFGLLGKDPEATPEGVISSVWRMKPVF